MLLHRGVGVLLVTQQLPVAEHEKLKKRRPWWVVVEALTHSAQVYVHRTSGQRPRPGAPASFVTGGVVGAGVVVTTSDTGG